MQELCRRGKNVTLGRSDFQYGTEIGCCLLCDALIKGVEVRTLETDERYPEDCFIENQAVVNSKVAVISWLGDATIMGEEKGIAQILSGYRVLESTTSLGSLEDRMY